MKCPSCQHGDTKVLESRLSSEGYSVRRRRMCLDCNHRFTTYEKEEHAVFQVRKKDGAYQEFQLEKIINALNLAFQKRNVSIEEIEGMAQDIHGELQRSGERLIDSKVIGDLVMKMLHERDQVAYVRYASIYKDFKDTDEFMKEVENLRKAGDHVHRPH